MSSPRSCQLRNIVLTILYCRTDLVSTFPTKRTPIMNVQFTPRNLCLVAGSYLAPEQR